MNYIKQLYKEYGLEKYYDVLYSKSKKYNQKGEKLNMKKLRTDIRIEMKIDDYPEKDIMTALQRLKSVLSNLAIEDNTTVNILSEIIE